jgi:hypothetical protein
MLRQGILGNVQRPGYHNQMFAPTLMPAFPGNGVSPILTKPTIVGQTTMPYLEKRMYDVRALPLLRGMPQRDGADSRLPYDRTFHPYDGISVAGRENPGTSFFRRSMTQKRDMMPSQLGDLSFSENKITAY